MTFIFACGYHASSFSDMSSFAIVQMNIVELMIRTDDVFSVEHAEVQMIFG